MSQLVTTLFWILCVIAGAGILGWLYRRWRHEGFDCGAGGPKARLGHGPSGHLEGHGAADLEGDARYSALLAEREALTRERDTLRIDAEGLRLKAQEGEALRARFAGGDVGLGGASYEGALNVSGDFSNDLAAELSAARARISELEAHGAAGLTGAGALGLSAAAPREVVRYVWSEGGAQGEGLAAPQALATLQGELDEARARLARYERGDLEADADLNGTLRLDLDVARARIAELEAEAAESADLRLRAEEAATETESAWGELEALRAELSAAKAGAEDVKSAADSELWALRQDLDEARARILDLEAPGGGVSGEAVRFAGASLSESEEGLVADLAAARARIADLEARWSAEAPAPREVVRYVWREGDEEAAASGESAEPAAFASLRAELEEARTRLARIAENGNGHGEEASGASLGFAASGVSEADLETLRGELFDARNRLADAEAAANAAGARDVALQADLNAAEARIRDLEAAAQAAADHAETLRVEAVASADGELARLRGELEAARGRVGELEAKGAEEAESWRVKLAEVETGAKAEAESLWERLRAGLEGDLAAARGRVSELEAKGAEEAESWRVKFADLEGGSAAEHDELARLRLELASARGRVGELEAKGVEEAESWRVKLAEVETGAKAESESLWERLRASLEGDLAAARGRVSELEAKGAEDAESWRVKFADLEAGAEAKAEDELARLRLELDAARGRVGELEAKGAEDAEAWRIKFADFETGTKAEAESVWERLRATLEGDLAAARGRVSELEAKGAEDAESWRVKFADLEGGSAAEHDELARLRLELDAARARLAQVESASAAVGASEEADALRLRIARLEAGASSSSSEIELLQSQLRSARGRIADLEASGSGLGGALGFAAAGAGAGLAVSAEGSGDLEALRRDLAEARLRIGELEAAEPRVEIREVIRYVERDAEADEDEAPLTDEEREAQELIRSGVRDFSRPELLLAAPRAGEAPDDLKLIRGIGPKLEGLLNANGIFYFEQLGAFTPRDIAWIDGQLEEFPGRILRDRWVPQAREFARLKREGRLTKGAGGASRAVFAEVGEAPARPAAEPKSVSAELTKVEAEALRLIDSGESFDDEDGFVLSAALPGPTRGEPDDLKRIRGVAYKLEEQLHALGIYYFSQIAEMSPREAAWLDWRLSLRGRVIRYRWIAQAQVFDAETRS